jgi:hypothetical protein
VAPKKKLYSNVPKVIPGRKPKTPAQKRRTLTKEADAEFLADLKLYMDKNPLAWLGLDVVTTGISGEEDRRGIAPVFPEHPMNIDGSAVYRPGQSFSKSHRKVFKNLPTGPAVWYAAGPAMPYVDNPEKKGVAYSKTGYDLDTLAHELGHIGEKYLIAQQEKGAPPGTKVEEHGEDLQRKIDFLRRKQFTPGIRYLLTTLFTGKKKTDIFKKFLPPRTEYEKKIHRIANRKYPQKRIQDLPQMKAAAQSLKQRTTKRRKKAIKKANNKTWNY